MRGLIGAAAAGLVASAAILHLAGPGDRPPTATRLVAEDASAPLRRIAIHYAPAADNRALPVWRQLLAELPPAVEVDVEVAAARDFTRLVGALDTTAHLERLRPVVVGASITTWARDRYAALVDDRGGGAILAPPRIETPFQPRAGDMRSPAAIARAIYGREPRVAPFVFEGGDIAATPRFAFVDVNLAQRNLGRTDASRDGLERELRRSLGQELVWLGDAFGDVPRHHIMMYMVPLDDTTIAVGDVRAGIALLSDARLPLANVDDEARRFDRAAALLATRGFRIVRVPAVVLAGAGSYITYTNALFDRRGDTRIIYMPTYRQPALDTAGAAFWRAQGYEVHAIDVSGIYTLNGSLGCLVNVLARG